jgi:hypothetical protein
MGRLQRSHRDLELGVDAGGDDDHDLAGVEDRHAYHLDLKREDLR